MSLEFRDVVKHYRTESEVIRAVDGVSLTVEPGEVVAIYGPSGSGKTTMLMLAAAMLRPDAGSVFAGGRNVSELPERAASDYRLQEVGFVFQSAHLIGSASVLDNAATKLLLEGLAPADARHRVIPWLERLGLGDRLKSSPSTLSSGQRQRIAIARALSNEPRLLLADEPTGNLDAERGESVLALLRELAHERALPVLLVTHDPSASDWVDRTFVLRDGQLTESADRPITSLRSAGHG